MIDEYIPEEMGIVEQLYSIASWIPTLEKRQEQSSIVAISTLLSGKKHSAPNYLLTQLVDEFQHFKCGLAYPNHFSFVAYLEEISRIVLSHDSIILFRKKLCEELCFILLQLLSLSQQT